MAKGNQDLEPEFRARRLWLFVGWSMVVTVIYLSLAPVSIDVGVEQGDKYLHALAYSALMLWFASLYTGPARRLLLAAALVGMGIAIEFLQGLTDYRTFEIADMVADAVGVGAGWLCAPPRLPNILSGVERLFHF